MSAVRKYAGLPDIDPSPDIYETPESIDDASTLPTSTTLWSHSVVSSNSDDLGDDLDGIDRHRINQDEARTQFLPATERPQPLSSRISGKRRAHKSLERKRGVETGDILNGIDVPSDQEEETLERKLARLRREITEVQSEVERQKSEVKGASNDPDIAKDSDVTTLAQLLDAVETSIDNESQTATSRLARRLDAKTQNGAPKGADPKTEAQMAIPTITDTNITGSEANGLSMVAVLDARLRALEDILGLDAIPTEAYSNTLTKPLLPALDVLDKQFNTLSTSSEASIDKIEGRVRELIREAEMLEMKRTQAKKALEAMSSSNIRSRSSTNAEVTTRRDLTEDPEQMSKVNALYGTLSTIESMAPLLPLVLERLRSLRDLHANAAGASQSLTKVEKEQEDMQDEIRSWREGLEKVESAMQQHQGTLKENTGLIGGWVKELEQRMKAL